MATPSKAQFLTDVQTLLKKRYKPKPEKEGSRLTVLEAVVYAIAHEGSTRTLAGEALGRFKSDFFDWNEVRVSTIEEVKSTLDTLPHSEARAQKVRRFLRQLFVKTYGFTLEALAKKPLKESMKTLLEYEALESDFVQSTVIQQSLGGHAIPVDDDGRRALERLGVIEHQTEISAVRSLLERAVPKNRGAEFRDLLEDLAHDTCVQGVPDCPRCELKKICPTALHKKELVAHPAKVAPAEAKAAAKAMPKAAPKAEKTKASTEEKSHKVAPPEAAPTPVEPAPSKIAAAKPPKAAKGRRQSGQ